MRNAGAYGTLVFLFLFSISARADLVDGVSAGVGYSANNTIGYRLAVRKSLETRWWDGDTGYLSAYFEGGIHFWTRHDDDVLGLAFSPVLTYNFDKVHPGLVPYVEGGIGGAYISETSMGDRNFSTHFQFENRIGLGLRFGEEYRHDVNLRYMHYSNAAIETPNDGMDFLFLSYVLHF